MPPRPQQSLCPPRVLAQRAWHGTPARQRSSPRPHAMASVPQPSAGVRRKEAFAGGRTLERQPTRMVITIAAPVAVTAVAAAAAAAVIADAGAAAGRWSLTIATGPAWHGDAWARTATDAFAPGALASHLRVLGGAGIPVVLLGFPPRSGPRDSEQGPAEERHEGQEHGLLVISRAIDAAASQQSNGALRRLGVAPAEDTVSRVPELDATANETGHLGSEGAQKRGGGGCGRDGPSAGPPSAEGPPAQETPCTTRSRSAHVRRWSAPEHNRPDTRTHTHTDTYARRQAQADAPPHTRAVAHASYPHTDRTQPPSRTLSLTQQIVAHRTPRNAASRQAP